MNLLSASFLHLIFPDLAAKTAFELFYSRVGQHTSVGGYWNDPQRQELYMKYSEFLPLINNENGACMLRLDLNLRKTQ